MKNTKKIVTVVTYNGASADMKPILSDNRDKSGVYPLTNPADLVDGEIYEGSSLEMANVELENAIKNYKSSNTTPCEEFKQIVNGFFQSEGTVSACPLSPPPKKYIYIFIRF